MLRFALAFFALASAIWCQTPKHYTCNRATTPIRIDGNLDDAAWRDAAWTGDFVDIEGAGHATPRYRTRVKMLWDDQYLYVAAELEEPHVWATLTEHDSVIFRDNDFEVFLNPSGDTLNYFEFEMNALNTGWDLFLNKPYRQGGKADDSWEIPGLLTAVHVDGTLNDSRDRDRGWSIEIAFPWSAFGSRAPVKRPAAGDAGAGETPRRRRRLAHQLLPRGVANRYRRREVRQSAGTEGRQLGLVAARFDRYARAGTLGLCAFRRAIE
jgi:hypothetical protein